MVIWYELDQCNRLHTFHIFFGYILCILSLLDLQDFNVQTDSFVLRVVLAIFKSPSSLTLTGKTSSTCIEGFS